MREAFVADGAEVRYLVCEFEEDVLSWRAFRREVIGATDPEAAADGSARAALRASWEELGLDAAPSTGNNGVHASAGPLEGPRSGACGRARRSRATRSRSSCSPPA